MILTALGYRKPHKCDRPFSIVDYTLIKSPDRLSVHLITRVMGNSDDNKLIAPVMALEGVSQPWLVSINFSYETLRKLLASKVGFRRAVQQHINNHLPKTGATHFLFVLEKARYRWHLHGVVACPTGDISKVRDALKRVAGKGGPPVAMGRLVHLQKPDPMKHFLGQFGLCGWALYLGKCLSKSSSDLKGSPLMASEPLRLLMNKGKKRPSKKFVPPKLVTLPNGASVVIAEMPDDWGIF